MSTIDTAHNALCEIFQGAAAATDGDADVTPIIDKSDVVTPKAATSAIMTISATKVDPDALEQERKDKIVHERESKSIEQCLKAYKEGQSTHQTNLAVTLPLLFYEKRRLEPGYDEHNEETDPTRKCIHSSFVNSSDANNALHLIDKHTCIICHQMDIKKACHLKCCKLVVCQPCLEQYLVINKGCPKCKRKTATSLGWVDLRITPSTYIESLFDTIRVHCKSDRGCEWNGEWCEWKTHMSTTCAVKDWVCAGCLTHVAYKDQANHMLRECPIRMESCSQCKRYILVTDLVIHERTLCHERKVPCLNGCGELGTLNYLRHQHICPMDFVPVLCVSTTIPVSTPESITTSTTSTSASTETSTSLVRRQHVKRHYDDIRNSTDLNVVKNMYNQLVKRVCLQDDLLTSRLVHGPHQGQFFYNQSSWMKYGGYHGLRPKFIVDVLFKNEVLWHVGIIDTIRNNVPDLKKDVESKNESKNESKESEELKCKEETTTILPNFIVTIIAVELNGEDETLSEQFVIRRDSTRIAPLFSKTIGNDAWIDFSKSGYPSLGKAVTIDANGKLQLNDDDNNGVMNTWSCCNSENADIQLCYNI